MELLGALTTQQIWVHRFETQLEVPPPPGWGYIQITPERVAPAERAAGLATRANMPSDSSKAEVFCRSSRCDAARAGDVTPLIFCNRKDEGGYGLDAGSS